MTSNDPFGLAGKICAVTGGGSGIGRGVAVALAREGAIVAILDRDQAGADETLALVLQSGGAGIALNCDVSSRNSIESARDAVRRRFGDPQILVNVAGIIRPGAMETLSLEDWNNVLAVNLTGYFQCSQVFGRPMLENRRGALIHVSSVMADYPSPFAGAYSITKAGIQMLSRQLAAEWGPSGVRSNCVAPALVYTPMSKTVYETPGVTERRSAAVPARRIGMPEDIAEAVLFLASSRASYINGTELMVDGGFVSNLMALIPRTGYEREDVTPGPNGAASSE
jgi:NAD(P)-dependent dehydrogenase (short-subunit alcohol dehydrogenase family)